MLVISKLFLFHRLFHYLSVKLFLPLRWASVQISHFFCLRECDCALLPDYLLAPHVWEAWWDVGLQELIKNHAPSKIRPMWTAFLIGSIFHWDRPPETIVLHNSTLSLNKFADEPLLAFSNFHRHWRNGRFLRVCECDMARHGLRRVLTFHTVEAAALLCSKQLRWSRKPENQGFDDPLDNEILQGD